MAKDLDRYFIKIGNPNKHEKLFNLTSNQRNANYNYNRIPYIPIRSAKF